jgi:hypothetical protein
MMLEQLQVQLEIRMIAFSRVAHTMVPDRTIVLGPAKLVGQLAPEPAVDHKMVRLEEVLVGLSWVAVFSHSCWRR